MAHRWLLRPFLCPASVVSGLGHIRLARIRSYFPLQLQLASLAGYLWWSIAWSAGGCFGHYCIPVLPCPPLASHIEGFVHPGAPPGPWVLPEDGGRLHPASGPKGLLTTMTLRLLPPIGRDPSKSQNPPMSQQFPRPCPFPIPGYGCGLTRIITSSGGQSGDTVPRAGIIPGCSPDCSCGLGS